MKKITFFIAAIAAILSINAQEITLNFSTVADITAWGIPTTQVAGPTVGTYTRDGYTISIAATEGNYHRGYNDAYVLTGKQGATVTLPAFSFDVEKIVIVGRAGASSATKQNIFVGETAVSTETTGAVGTNEYVIAPSAQAAGTVYVLKITSAHNTQFTQIQIFKKSATNQATTPEITPNVDLLTAPTAITITSATAGATIYYTTNGAAPTASSTQYSAPFQISATTTVKAIAVKTGLTNSAIAEKTYTFPTVVANIAAFNALADNTIAKLTGDITLVYQNGQNSYWQDASGYMLGYGAELGELGNGTVFHGAVAKKTTYSGFPEAVAPFAFDSYDLGTPVAPAVIAPANLTTADYARYVKFENVRFAANVEFSTTATVNGTLVSPEGFTIRDAFHKGGTYTADKTYNISGFVTYYNNAAQLYPTEITERPNSVSKPSTEISKIYSANGSIIINADKAQLVEIYNAVGQKLVTRNVVAGVNAIPVNTRGIVVVKFSGKISKVIVK